MAKFLSKFVNKNHPSLSPEPEGRSRTISDVGPVRSRTVSALGTSDIPSLTLTSENGDSPMQPSTPGSLHRTNSKESGGGHRGRAESLSVVERKHSNSSLTASQLNPNANMGSRASTAVSGSSASPAVTGLGIDLGASDETNATQQAAVTPDSASASSGGLGRLRHKHSAKSLKSQQKPSPLLKSEASLPQVPVPASQEIDVPERSQSMELVDSPKSEGNENTPTTARCPLIS